MALEPLLTALRDGRILHLDADLVVVDKPPGLVVHGGDADLPEDLVRRLRLRLGESAYLGVHQRLDKEASGVLLLTRSRKLNAAVASDFEQRRAKKTYVAVVELQPKARRFEASGVFDDRLDPQRHGQTRVVQRGGQHALTHYRVLQRVGSRLLLQLNPRTGRTHQLRAQLAHRGAPIGGDMLYGGADAPRLMLHAEALELPSIALRHSAPVPASFERWLQSAPEELPPPNQLQEALLDAAMLRAPLLGRTEAFRLVNDSADGLPGVTIDAYGEYLVLSLAGAAVARQEELARLLVEHGARGVYLKVRAKADLRRLDASELAPSRPVQGPAAPEPLSVQEHERCFEVNLASGLSTGLFVDQRDNRSLVQTLVRPGDRCLNLFCYTGSFSVAAALGGAEVTSVDISRPALDWARRNFELNGLQTQQHSFLREDAVAFLSRAVRRQQRFQLLIIDPPSFATVGKRTFRIERDYPRMLEDAVRALSSGAYGLVVTNHAGTSQKRLRSWVKQAVQSAGRELVQMKDTPSRLDCPPAGGQPHPSRSVLFKLS